jgi:hypothetical protein
VSKARGGGEYKLGVMGHEVRTAGVVAFLNPYRHLHLNRRD